MLLLRSEPRKLPNAWGGAAATWARSRCKAGRASMAPEAIARASFESEFAPSVCPLSQSGTSAPTGAGPISPDADCGAAPGAGPTFGPGVPSPHRSKVKPGLSAIIGHPSGWRFDVPALAGADHGIHRGILQLLRR